MKEIIKANSLHRLNLQVTEFVENHLSMADQLTIVTTITNGEYVATIIQKDAGDAMKELLVDEHEYIDHFWMYEDIRGRLKELGYEDYEDEICEIAQGISSKVDCEYGLTWQFIDDMIYDCLGVPGDEEEEDDSDEFRHVIKNLTPEQ